MTTHATLSRAAAVPPADAVTERALVFDCQGETLVGVVSTPDRPGDTGVLIVVGGPQYRVGAHRQFVHLARHLAAGGFPVMRFDVRGMGDSAGSQRSFESLSDDLAAAVDALLESQRSVKRVVLWGLCDGASAALLYLHRRMDPRVAGLVLLNPWVRTAQGQALTTVKHYYRQRLLERAFWLKLLRGQVALGALSSLWANLRRARGRAEPANTEAATPYTDRMEAAAQQFPGPVLVILSGRDYTAKEFVEHTQSRAIWRQVLARGNVTTQTLETADHTFSVPGTRQSMQDLTVEWLLRATPPTATQRK